MAAPEKLPASGGESLGARDDTRATTLASSSSPSLVRQVVTWFCVVSAPLLAIIIFFPVVRAVLQQQQWILTIFKEHYAAIFGLPSAALISSMLVVVFEARFDNIEMR